MKLLISFLLLSSFFISFSSSAAKYVNDGGTNHFLHSYGTANLGRDINGSWYWNPGRNIRTPVAYYHLDKNLVDSQISALKASGQTTYTVVIPDTNLYSCQSSACNNGFQDGVWGELIDNAYNGNFSMRPQHRVNIKSIIGKALDAGFKRVIVRFGRHNAPGDWVGWDETKYQQTWNFLVDARNAAREEVFIRNKSHLLSYPNNILLFDLSIEDGGSPDVGQKYPFMIRLWQDYSSAFGNDDTVGFSMAWESGRFTKMLQMLNSTGVPLPKMWAASIYTDPGTDLTNLYNEMGSLKNQPFFVLETWFNHSNTSAAIQQALNNNTLQNIASVIQWPNEYITYPPGTSVSQMRHYTAYAIDSLTSNTTFSSYTPLLAARRMNITSSNADYLGVQDSTCGQGSAYPCSVNLFYGPSGSSLHAIYIKNGSAYTLMWCVTGSGQEVVPWITGSQRYIFESYDVPAQTTTCPSSPNTSLTLRAIAEATPY